VNIPLRYSTLALSTRSASFVSLAASPHPSPPSLPLPARVTRPPPPSSRRSLLLYTKVPIRVTRAAKIPGGAPNSGRLYSLFGVIFYAKYDRNFVPLIVIVEQREQDTYIRARVKMGRKPRKIRAKKFYTDYSANVFWWIAGETRS